MKRRGVTFVELVISIFLVNLVVLIFIAVLSGGLPALRRVSNKDVATKLAKAKMEEMMLTQFSRLSTVASASQTGEGLPFSGSFGEYANYRYRIEAGPAESSPQVQMSPTVSGLSFVTVFVRGPFDGAAHGFGYTEVRLAAVIAPPAP